MAENKVMNGNGAKSANTGNNDASVMLEADNITKVFNPDTVDAKKALDGLSIKVKKGDFISIIGANGAGKSTLFNAIAGSFITDSGRIMLDGEDITLLPEYKRAKQIGRLFQDPLR